MAFWNQVAPAFLGQFLALICVVMLMGKTRKLLVGPHRFVEWINKSSQYRRWRHGGRRHVNKKKKHVKKKKAHGGCSAHAHAHPVRRPRTVFQTAGPPQQKMHKAWEQPAARAAAHGGHSDLDRGVYDGRVPYAANALTPPDGAPPLFSSSMGYSRPTTA